MAWMKVKTERSTRGRTRRVAGRHMAKESAKRRRRRDDKRRIEEST